MNSFKTISRRWLAIAMVLPVMIFFTGCDEDNTIIDLVEDGVYATGTATGASGLSNDFAFFAGRAEGDGFASDLRTGMFEGFVYLSAGNLGITSKVGPVETAYGAAAGSQTTRVIADCGDQIDGVSVITGTLEQGGGDITIPSAGMYHVIIDMTSMTFHAYIIGDFQFTNGFQTMAKGTSNASGTTWTGTDIQVNGEGKFRWNDGWKIIEIDGAGTDCDETAGNGDWSTAYIIFTNVGKGDAATDFRMGGGNWTASELTGGTAPGLFTISISFIPREGWSLSATRTGDIPAQDLSGESLEIIGAGVNSNGTEVGWTDGQQGQTPSLSGGLYTWTYTGISFNTSEGFKFRTTGDWNSTFNLGCSDFTFDGPDASAMNNCDDNAGTNDMFGNVSATDYTLVVSIDGNDVTSKTVTVTAE